MVFVSAMLTLAIADVVWPEVLAALVGRDSTGHPVRRATDGLRARLPQFSTSTVFAPISLPNIHY